MALKDVLLQHPDRRYIMFGGGGRVPIAVVIASAERRTAAG